MVFIFSSSDDLSTDFVIDWLNYYKHPFFRFNSEDIFKQPFKIDLFQKTVQFEKEAILIENINAVWFRKLFIVRNFDLFKSTKLNFEMHLNLQKEHLSVFKTMYHLLKNKKWLTNPIYLDVNKCSILLEAMSVGLDIPKTYIINSSKDISVLINTGEYITKTSHQSIFLFDKGLYTMYTKSVNKKLITKYPLPDIISPSLVQEKIEKNYEIRTFFIEDKFYSMAIFSQENHRTQEDFRDLDWDNPNRIVPYKLPSIIEEKTKKLMHRIGLNCGSIDYIKGVDNKYYFLEINPVGQYGMVDIPCNYNLNKEIALELIKMDQM